MYKVVTIENFEDWYVAWHEEITFENFQEAIQCLRKEVEEVKTNKEASHGLRDYIINFLQGPDGGEDGAGIDDNYGKGITIQVLDNDDDAILYVCFGYIFKSDVLLEPEFVFDGEFTSEQTAAIENLFFDVL